LVGSHSLALTLCNVLSICTRPWERARFCKGFFSGNALIHNGHHVAGTMTFGEQNTFEDACEQLNFATENGINFLDAAEMCVQRLYEIDHN